MSENDQKPVDDVLDQAVREFKDCRVPVGPATELVASTVAAINLLPTTAKSAPADERRKRIMRYLRNGSGAAAAALLAIVAGIYWLDKIPAEASYQKALEKAEQAKSFRAVATISIGEAMTVQMKFAGQGDLVRIETEGVIVVIGDAKKKVGLQLDLKNKTAEKLDFEKMKGDKRVGQVADMFKKLREKKGDEVQSLTDEEIAGRKLKVYGVKGVVLGDKKTDWKIWIDPQTDVAVKMQMESREGPKMTTTFEWFWNEALDATLFSLEVPSGFKLKGS
jgi:hypothetical protein